MASLFIDGEWVGSADGTCSQVVNPSDGSVVIEVDVATDEQVQAAIETYLARNGIDTTGMTYAFENLTNPALGCPTEAEQLDHFRMTVSMPFDNVKWALIPQITPTTAMSVTIASGTAARNIVPTPAP